jgi:hypothetical protein
MLFKKNKNQFELDLSRLVKIDGRDFIITGFTADRSYYEGVSKLAVYFEPFDDFVERKSLGAS